MAEYKYDNPQLTESFKNHMNEVYGASAFQYPRYDFTYVCVRYTNTKHA